MKKLLFLFLLMACATDAEINNLKFDDYVKAYNETDGAILIDVRTPEEWENGKIEGSLLANIMDKSFDDVVEEIDREKPVFVYCKIGSRSGKAAKKLSQMGFRNIYNLKSAGYEDLATVDLK